MRLVTCSHFLLAACSAGRAFTIRLVAAFGAGHVFTFTLAAFGAGHAFTIRLLAAFRTFAIPPLAVAVFEVGHVFTMQLPYAVTCSKFTC